jgi:hypothetical protein
MNEIDKLVKDTYGDEKPKIDLGKVYNEYKEVSKETSRKVTTWFTKYLEQIIALIFAFVLIGVQQFAEPHFDPYFFLRPKFWFEYLPYVTAIWVIIFAVLTGNNKWLVDVDVEYQKTYDAIQKHVDDDRTTPYIHEGATLEDEMRKTFAWKTKVSKRIEKLRKKYQIGSTSALMQFVGYKKRSIIKGENGENETVEEVFSGDDTIVAFKIKVLQNARKRGLRKRLNYLLNLLDDNYIKENLENLNVKYDKVTASILTSGISPSSVKRNTSNYQEKFGSTVFDEFGTGFLVFSLVSAFILSLDLIRKEVGMETWIFFAFKGFMLFTYYLRANARSKVIFKKTVVKALKERLETLDECKRKVLHKT